mmetsp:Transcript_4230/g.11206  ORF Transcript_4230/g.11206 Transcript_4230/m.11206 type:complete len:192 (+) Transcript_4230:34-609(+)
MGVPAQELRPVWQRLGRTIDPTAVAEVLESLHVGAAARVSKEDAAPAPEVGASSSGEAFEENVGAEQDEDERVQLSLSIDGMLANGLGDAIVTCGAVGANGRCCSTLAGVHSRVHGSAYPRVGYRRQNRARRTFLSGESDDARQAVASPSMPPSPPSSPMPLPPLSLPPRRSRRRGGAAPTCALVAVSVAS